MNLTELATFVCDKVRKPDAESLAACKDFIKRRDEMLWNGHLWRDSIIEFTKAVGPSMLEVYPDEVALAAQGVVYVPPVVDRILAVRSGDRALPVEQVENYFRQNLDAFSQTGQPLEFSLLPPVAAAFSSPATLLQINNDDSADNGVAVTIRVISKGTGTYGARSVSLSMTGSIQLVATYVDEVVGMDKPATTGNVILYRNGVGNVTSLSPTSTTLPLFQRIRLAPTPTDDLTLRILAKQKYIPLVSDYQEPRLRQSDNVLIAYVMGDMLQRRQQFGKARDCFAEGAALLDDLVRLEVDQQARNERLVPDVEPWQEDWNRMGRLKAY